MALISLVSALLICAVPAAAAPFAAECTFKLGFKDLHDLIPEIVGDCLGDERFEQRTGNAFQPTSGGLLVWRKADNWTAFTDGAMTWINGPFGLESRDNAARFTWELDATTVDDPIPPGPGAVLLSDAFDDPSTGQLPQSSGVPAEFVVGYLDGEYVIQKLDLSGTNLPTATLPGTYADASVAFDVRLVGNPVNQYVAAACRSQVTDPEPGQSLQSSSEYRLVVAPSLREFALIRYDDSEQLNLANFQTSLAIEADNASNRIELICHGASISGRINGVQVVAAEDSTYAEGAMLIGVGVLDSALGIAEARFDNLVVTQQ